MPLPDSDTTQITFQDVAASFSEEEWKLLHKWQKELYTSIMKDIHMVLISLGPIIAASVFSLSKKGKDGLCCVDNLNSDRSDQRESIDDTVISICLEEEDETCSLNHLGSKIMENTNSLTGFPPLNAELCMTDEDASTLKLTDRSAEVERVNTNTSSYASTMKSEIDYSIVFQRSGKGTPTKNQLFAENIDGTEEEKTTQLFFLKGDSYQHHETHLTPSVSTVPQRNSNLRINQNRQEKRCEQLRRTGVKPYTCSLCAKRFVQNSTLRRHERTHSGMRYACSECEKSFTRKEMLNIHKRTHTGEKPYQCPDCDKSFSHKGYLSFHKRKHTGEKPYMCAECGKSFGNKSYLSIHERTHTGEKPYQCCKCEKCFSQKGSRRIHEKTHKCEKPDQ